MKTDLTIMPDTLTMNLSQPIQERVVVTGIGAITPLGHTADSTWEGLVQGVCAIDEITLFDTTGFKTNLAAEVKQYNR